MENTPLKNQTTPTTTTPLPSKYEDSPVFNYISNLSPIGPVKSLGNDHTFNSLAFASLPSIFTSPQNTSSGESRFSLRRHQFSEARKLESFQSGNQSNKCEGVPVSVQQSYFGAPGSSATEVTNAVPAENLELAVELPNTLKYSCGSLDSNVPLCDATPASLVQSVIHHSKERHPLFERETHLLRVRGVEREKEAAGGDWVRFVSDAAVVLNFDSTTIEENPEGQDDISNILQDSPKDMEVSESLGPIDSSEQCELRKFSNQSEGIGDLKETDQAPAILSRTLLDKLNVQDPHEILDDKLPKGIHSNCKPSSQSYTISRRCLDFERAATHKRKSICDTNGSYSVSLHSNSEVNSVETKLIQTTTGFDCSSSRLPGIGLHLNALATSSENTLSKVVNHETQAYESQRIYIPNSKILSTSVTSGEVSCDESCKNEVPVAETAPQARTPVGVESDHGIPEKKRLKSQHGESLGCKRCNCKKSKCLKLYCDCFAAGLYCCGPCSCQDCFNKPIFENIVLENRRLIESRNPLAFAPKVTGKVDAISQFGEATNSTPSSARHKRGCNCRKSSCLKKYCECFQGGAGCSLLCRCVACKNTFGRKDEVEEIEIEGEESGVWGTARDRDLPLTLSGVCRPLGNLASTFNGKQKIFSLHSVLSSPQLEKQLQVIPEDGTLETLDGSCSQLVGVKSTSPNSKRVSPPHSSSEFGSDAWRGGRKLVLRSIPPFPTLESPRKQ